MLTACGLLVLVIALIGVFVVGIVVGLLPLALLLTLRHYRLTEEPRKFFVVGLLFILVFQIIFPLFITAGFSSMRGELEYLERGVAISDNATLKKLSLEPFWGSGETGTFTLRGEYSGDPASFSNLSFRFYRYGSKYREFSMENASYTVSGDNITFTARIRLEKGLYNFTLYDAATNRSIMSFLGPINTSPAECYAWLLYFYTLTIGAFNLFFFGLISLGVHFIEKKARFRMGVMRNFER
jgi:hypothetical protein